MIILGDEEAIVVDTGAVLLVTVFAAEVTGASMAFEATIVVLADVSLEVAGEKM